MSRPAVIDRRPRLTAAPVAAWMGGSRPLPLCAITAAERRDVSVLFREQFSLHAGYWGDIEREVARLFFKRARFDAHATHRSQS